MPKIIFALFSDQHLQPVTWQTHPDLRGDAYFSYKQVVDFCVNNQCDLLSAGDLFDKAKPDSGSVKFFIEQTSRLAEKGLHYRYIDGNHDKAEPSWASLAAGSLPLNFWEVAGWLIVGIPFTSKAYLPGLIDEVVEKIPAKYPTSRVMFVCHQAWDEIQGVGNTHGSLSMFPDGSTVFTGDYHKTLEKMVGNTRVFSPGSGCMQALNEPEDKWFYAVYDDGTVDKLPIKTRDYHRRDLKTEEDLESLLAENLAIDPDVNNPVRKPILHMVYPSDMEGVYDKVKGRFGESAYLFFRPQPSHNDVVVGQAPVGGYPGLVDAINHLSGVDSTVSKGAKAILESSNKQKTLTELRGLFKEYHINANKNTETS